MTPARLFRCNNCVNDATGANGVDFTAPADKPVCPTCGANRNDPDEAALIDELVVIHWEPAHPKAHRFKKLIGTKGCGHVACQPGKKHFGTNLQVTGDPSVANCPACKATKEFKAATGTTLNPKYDLPVGFNEAGDLQFLPNPDGVKLLEPAAVPSQTGDDE